MTASPKPFQQDTVEAACRTLQQIDGARRFLVADEVGLGKTVVAREIVRRMAVGHKSALVVYYITNSHRIANQNRGRLVDFLPENVRKQAISRADRLALIPMSLRPATPVALYGLTPITSFPGRTARLHGGRKEERAFIAGLLRRAYPHLVRRLPPDLLQGAARLNWPWLLDHYRREAVKAPRALVRAFRAALRVEFGGDPRRTLANVAKTQSFGRTVGQLRRALAHAALISDPPDLVIFDEFQRYRDLLSREGRQDRLVATLLSTSRRSPPAILLLSATPYRLYATRWEESRGAEAHRELFDLLEFLGGSNGAFVRERAVEAFTSFGDHIRLIAAAPSDAENLGTLVAAAEAKRQALQDLLAPLMSRTERETKALADGSQTISLPSNLSPADVRAYRHLVTSFRPQHRGDALAYWLSVPLAAQALGIRYQAWKHADIRRDRKLTKLTLQARNRLDPAPDWPHPKLRALRLVAPPESLALPWAPPSLPWWPLEGPWAHADAQPKLLLFSRFKATPQSIAALTSFGLETTYLRRDTSGYERAWRRRRLQPGPGRLPIMALFHPSPFLIMAAEPSLCAGKDLRSVRRAVRSQLVNALAKLDIEVRRKTVKDREKRRPAWSLVSALDQRAGFRGLTDAAWSRVGASDRRLLELVSVWHTTREIDWISPRELDDLVGMAISSPGVLAGRALLRHYAKALDGGAYDELIRLTWGGLRAYLDNPIFWARLKGRTPVAAIQRAALEGGFEALLDEHFWILKQASSSAGADMAGELHGVLSMMVGSFSFHPIGPKSDRRIRIRCHAAVPFGGTDDELTAITDATGARPARSDELRKAFNAPFWPYVLTTTSVGQEGLDFHTWCSRVAHWDLCSSPLDLEQREGRIQRFGGLLIRRRLAERIAPALLARPRHPLRSIWDELAAEADRELSDASGLSPWWLLPDTGVTRYIFELPQGRDAARFRRLREQRFIYRLALGQPNQEDLLDVLSRSSPTRLALLRPLALNLSAFSRSPSQQGTSLVPDERPLESGEHSRTAAE
jgi:hypothetical protein